MSGGGDDAETRKELRGSLLTAAALIGSIVGAATPVVTWVGSVGVAWLGLLVPLAAAGAVWGTLAALAGAVGFFAAQVRNWPNSVRALVCFSLTWLATASVAALPGVSQGLAWPFIAATVLAAIVTAGLMYVSRAALRESSTRRQNSL